MTDTPTRTPGEIAAAVEAAIGLNIDCGGAAGVYRVRDAVLAAVKPELDALAALRAVAHGYCPACGRGDAAPTVADWETQRDRAQLLASTLDDVLRRQSGIDTPGCDCGHDGMGRKWHGTSCPWRASCSPPREGSEPNNPAPAEPQATGPDWTPPPPGDTREQLPDHLLALIRPRLRGYTSTACQTADYLAQAIADHPEHGVELSLWSERMHARCRRNQKYTGELCPHHSATRPAGTEETEPCTGRVCAGSGCSHEQAATALTVHDQEIGLYDTGPHIPDYTVSEAQPANDEECCGTEPPTRADDPNSSWGDCWCTRPPGHDGEHRCEPCTERYGAPGWTGDTETTSAGTEETEHQENP